jgi:hypothetical protein
MYIWSTAPCVTFVKPTETEVLPASDVKGDASESESERPASVEGDCNGDTSVSSAVLAQGMREALLATRRRHLYPVGSFECPEDCLVSDVQTAIYDHLRSPDIQAEIAADLKGFEGKTIYHHTKCNRALPSNSNG